MSVHRSFVCASFLFLILFKLQAEPSASTERIIVEEFLPAATGLEAADIDLDGRVDLVASSYYRNEGEDYTTQGYIVWYQQLAPNQWSPVIPIDQIRGVWTMKVADLDEDGDVDIVAATTFSDSNMNQNVWWYENQVAQTGEVSFTKRIILSLPHSFHDFSDPRSLDIADWNHDGSQDLAIGFQHGTDASAIRIILIPNFLKQGVPLGNGNWNQSHYIHLEKPSDSGINGFAMVRLYDIDQNGLLDVVASTAWEGVTGFNYVSFSQDSPGEFHFRPLAGGDPDAGGLWGSFSGAVADMNVDGRPDLICQQGDISFVSDLYIAYNFAAESNGPWTLTKIDDAVLGSTVEKSVVTGDLDLDGRPDIVSTNLLSNSVTITRNTCAGFERYDLGDFSPSVLELADLDGDQIPEVIAGEWAGLSNRGLLQYWRLNEFRYGCPTDTNRDGQTDFADLKAVLNKYGSSCACCGEDTNQDGLVDHDDLERVLSFWGGCF